MLRQLRLHRGGANVIGKLQLDRGKAASRRGAKTLQQRIFGEQMAEIGGKARHGILSLAFPVVTRSRSADCMGRTGKAAPPAPHAGRGEKSDPVLAAHLRASDVKQRCRTARLVARMERSEIRVRSTSFNVAPGFPALASAALRATRSIRATKEKIREAERRQTQVSTVPHAYGARVAPRKERLAPPFRSRARSPAGVPPRLSPRGLTSPKAQPRPGFLGRGLSGRYPPSPVPVQ